MLLFSKYYYNVFMAKNRLLVLNLILSECILMFKVLNNRKLLKVSSISILIALLLRLPNVPEFNSVHKITKKGENYKKFLWKIYNSR